MPAGRKSKGGAFRLCVSISSGAGSVWWSCFQRVYTVVCHLYGVAPQLLQLRVTNCSAEIVGKQHCDMLQKISLKLTPQ